MGRIGHASRALARNGRLLRVLAAWLMFVLAEYAVWIAMLVYAYARGGASTAGIVAVAQLVPGVAAGPLLSTLADRRSPMLLLVGGYLVQAVGMVVTAVVMYTEGPALIAYAGAVVASTAMTATRPAQATLIPAVARDADELTASNAIEGWLENIGIVAAGLLTGLALGGGQPGLVFAASALATTVAALVLLPIRVPPMNADGEAEVGAFTAVRQGLSVLKDRPRPRLLVALITAQYIVVGALDLLFVVLAISVLHEGAQWSGYLNTAYGIGGVVAGTVTVALLGRRLGAPILVAAAVLCAGLATTAASGNPTITLVLLAAVGLGRSVLDTATHTLLQRTVPSDLLGRIFGVVEGLSMAGLAAGSLLVPALSSIGGTHLALIGTAAIIPLAALLGGRAVTALDSGAHVPVVEIALLRSMPHFRALPTPELEGLAAALDRQEFAGGTTIITQGDPGDVFYAIAEGQVDVRVDDVHVAMRSRPEGLGEIALLHKVPRSASVVADGPVVVYALDGDAFLAVVTGHDATRRRAEAVASERLLGDRR